MSHPLVTIVEPNQNRRQILSLLVRAASQVDVLAVPRFDIASSALPGRVPCLMICPWDDGGEDLVTRRVIAEKTLNRSSEPYLLILTQDITPGRIAVCGRAGRAQLIPSAPLNMNALRNRILLYLEGSATLAARLSRSGTVLRTALETLPALRRRLAI